MVAADLFLVDRYDGPRPDKKIAADCGDTYHYQPMRKQGAIILGTGGDNSVLSTYSISFSTRRARLPSR